MGGRDGTDELQESWAGPGDDELQRVQDVWDAQARADPLWAVLSDPQRLGRRWDLHGFMATGEAHVSGALARYAALGGTFPDRHRALDFGCGVGRLAQALADRFDSVLGLDISPTMVEVAGRLNRHGSRVRYQLNGSTRLAGIASGSVTLVFCHITLQHVPSDLARAYLVEFLRVVEPGGGVIVQVPSHYAESYLPVDRDDLPVAVDDRHATVDLPEHPGVLPAGASVEVAVELTNASDGAWTQSAIHPLHVGNHWLRGESEVVAWNDGRARLPGRVRPGESVRIALTIRTPDEPGEYRLAVDVVQEGVCWFADDGPGPAAGAVLDVSVADLPRDDASHAEVGDRYFVSDSGARFDDLVSPEPLEPPDFEMNAIPRADVERYIDEAGATLLGVDERVNEWHSFTYYLRAREDGATASGGLP